jgi:hypothetical protein
MSIEVHPAAARTEQEIGMADALESNEVVSMALTTQSNGSAGTLNLPFWNHLLAGGISGTVGALITNPLEVIKTRFQASSFDMLVIYVQIDYTDSSAAAEASNGCILKCVAHLRCN